MKTFKTLVTVLLLIAAVSCKKYSELNPNVPGENAAVPPAYLLSEIEFELARGGGFVAKDVNAFLEGPFSTEIMKWNQYFVSNYAYYGGYNQYSWTAAASNYNQLTNTQLMEKNAASLTGNGVNPYSAVAKFLRAYNFIWLSQRVGDIPMSQAGQGSANPTPEYDSQHDVYKACLILLDSANAQLTRLIPKVTASNAYSNISGDIYYGNSLVKWQKCINTYRLRVLISLSKKADAGDASDIDIKGQFNTIVSNPAIYPVMTSNGDNLVLPYNSSKNPYPKSPTSFYNYALNVASTILSLTDSTKDPRTFVFATPSPYQVDSADAKLSKNRGLGKKLNDYTAYVGANIGQSLSDIIGLANAGKLSYINAVRYYASTTGPAASFGDESKGYVIIGYPEMCFNIAEGINRGWGGGSADVWYTNGIKASLSFFGVADGISVTIGTVSGATTGARTGKIVIGTDVPKIADFLAQPTLAYQGGNAGLEQIINQKYIAMWQNSGFEAYFNWLRTGYPSSFVNSGAGINPTGIIPRRFQYPTSEVSNNSINYNRAIQSQSDGNNDLNQDLWINK